MPPLSINLPLSKEDLDRLTHADWQAVIASDPCDAAQWMTHRAALGNANAQTVLGQWLLDGHGLERAPQTAFAWFLKAATHGQPMGMNMAGRCFENGWGTKVDTFVTANWCR